MQHRVRQRPKNPTRRFRQLIGLLCRGQYFLCRARALGEDILEISSDHPLTVGQLTLVNLPLSGETLITRARVVHIESLGSVANVRLEFFASDFEVQRMLRSYVANKINA